MSKRRMIKREIVESDKFIEMPLSTQAIYMHLILSADDDGFVSSPKRIIRGLGGSDDELKILIGKGFVIQFDSGIIVINNWTEHNAIRKDRYTPTTHLVENKTLQAIDLEQWQPSGNQVATGGCPSIGKVRLGEVSKDNIESVCVFSFDDFWNMYANKVDRKKCKAKYKRLSVDEQCAIMDTLPKYVENSFLDGKYPTRKNPLTYLNGECWNDEIIVSKENDAVGDWQNDPFTKHLLPQTLIEGGQLGID